MTIDLRKDRYADEQSVGVTPMRYYESDSLVVEIWVRMDGGGAAVDMSSAQARKLGIELIRLADEIDDPQSITHD